MKAVEIVRFLDGAPFNMANQVSVSGFHTFTICPKFRILSHSNAIFFVEIFTIIAPSNDLKAATVPLIAQEICREKRFYGDEIMDTMFCAGYLNKTGIDACDGDSGGPLVCADELGIEHLT